jgi:cyclin-dependent kinase regulatory subunit CKS1
MIPSTVWFVVRVCGTQRDLHSLRYRGEISSSDKYYDDTYEYRHVILPKEISRRDPRDHLLSEDEWRALGIQMSVGLIHCHRHFPEPNILLFPQEHHGTVRADVAR